MLTNSQKRFAGLVYACPLQNNVNVCVLSQYRNSISLKLINRQVKKINLQEVEDVLTKHHNCFMKKNEELFAKKLNYQIEIQKILTKRQFEIINFICKNNTNNDIAKKLKISHYTVENHRKKAYKRLNVRNVKELKSIIFRNDFF